MSRYFFDIQDGVDILDEVGREIADPQSVRREAAKVLSSLIAAEAEDSDGLTLILTVRDERNNTVLTIRMVSQIDERPRAAQKLAS